ncbi:hypothetical protein J2Z48_001400 [Croceifilum oryzae]|uniref:DUF3153 domain-containing protein n=1 Tax=Croceifilum oryzae TaxID=1553429 RepID=A0AAJ1TE84_9BACL|nr:hypothetical protein [Croceifilum oryzae]MDQ0417228.1 hypothetical protein [Croceifilum oryzae]
MRIGRQFRLLFILVLMMFALVGCVDADLHATVNRDGTGTFQLKVMTTDKQVWGKLKEAVGSEEEGPFKELEKKGFQKKITDQAGQYGFAFTKNIQDVANPKEWALMGEGDSNSEGVKFVKENGLLFTTYQLNKQEMGTAFSNAGELAGMINSKFKLTLPVKPDSHNADRVEDDGTLVWDLKNKKPIQVQVSVINLWVIVTLGIIGIVLIVGIIWFIKKRKNRADPYPPAWGQGSDPLNPTTMGPNEERHN